MDWLTYGHDYGNTRFSPLRQITSANVERLVPEYVFQTGVVGPFESTPLISNGVMYITSAYDGVFAVNARDGTLIWKKPPIGGRYRQCCGPVNRGVGITSDLVLVGQLDGVLLALDRATGIIKWSSVVADNATGSTITMAPLVYRGSAIVGVAGSEFGIRGSIGSYSLLNGHLLWRWYATDPQHWFGNARQLFSDSGLLDARTSDSLRKRFASSWKRGGGGIWTTPAIDVKRNTIYLTTGNPWPDTNGAQRPGDNLFTDSIVALDASSGRMKWYYQQTPHDTGDLDAASPPVLFDTEDGNGKRVAVVGEVGKTGLYYVLNRDTGSLVRRSQIAVSANGPRASNQHWEGGATWSATSFDPTLGYAVICEAQHLRPRTVRDVKMTPGNLSMQHWNSGYGTVSAINVTTGRVVWEDRFDQGLVGGVVRQPRAA